MVGHPMQQDSHLEFVFKWLSVLLSIPKVSCFKYVCFCWGESPAATELGLDGFLNY